MQISILEREIEEIRKKFHKLEKSLNSKKPRKNINTIYYEDLSSRKEPNVEDDDDGEYIKIGSVRGLFEDPNRNYYEPRVIDRGFAGKANNYIKYISEGDKDERLSPREYLNMTKPDLRDLINRHKLIDRLNNDNNNDNDNNKSSYNNT